MTLTAHITQPSEDNALMRSSRGLIALGSLPGVGVKTVLRMSLTGEYQAALNRHRGGWKTALDRADRQLDLCAKHGVTAVSLFDEDYPDRLRAIHEPPPVLFVRGSISALHELRSVAVVGTREPTSFGASATDHVVAELAKERWSIISGLARGVDTLAHAAALKHSTRTVAVMAGGLDAVYPGENRDLAAAVVARGGALVSEQMTGQRPYAAAFVARNRVQTALSAAVLVMQTGIRGGTTHTVRHAAIQGRPVFCPVPKTDHEKNRGLSTLLNTPASDLCRALPAWRDSTKLCRRLGSLPLAHPIEKSDVKGLLDCLQQAHSSPAETPADRWWAQPDPDELPTRSPWSSNEQQVSLFAAGKP